MLTAGLLGGLYLTPSVLGAPYGPESASMGLVRRDDPDRGEPYDITHHYSARAGWANASSPVTSIMANISLPFIRTPVGSKNVSASAWVQVDGDGCQSAALMAGIDMTVVNDTHMTYEAWWAEYPNQGKKIFDDSGCNPDDFSIYEGVHLMVDARDPDHYAFTVSGNNGTKTNCTHTIDAQDVAICRLDASWHLGRTDNNAAGDIVTYSGDSDFLFDQAMATFNYIGTGANDTNRTNGTMPQSVAVNLDGKALYDQPVAVGMRIVDTEFTGHKITKNAVDVLCEKRDANTVSCLQKDTTGNHTIGN